MGTASCLVCHAGLDNLGGRFCRDKDETMGLHLVGREWSVKACRGCDGSNTQIFFQQDCVVLTLARNPKPLKSTVDRVLSVCHLTFRAATCLPEREYGLVGRKPIYYQVHTK